MESKSFAIRIKENRGLIIADLLLFAAIALVPAFSHLLALPVYLIEPIRIILILAIAHTRKENAYLMAVALPIISYAASGHPYFPKMLIICVELVINVWMFYLIVNRYKNAFIAMAAGIVFSKLLYYAFQYILITLFLPASEFGHHSIMIQLAVTIGLSSYIYLFYKQN